MTALRRLVTATSLIAALALPGLLPPTSGAADSPPRVSVISDSILTSVTWNNDGVALADLSNGLDLEIDAGVGRRLNGQSAEFEGSYVPTTLSVISSWINQLGSIVVIVDGYNDLPDNFAGDVELTLDTLRDHGVQHVLWVNLHEVRPEFAAKNAVLAAAARRHPELRILDWNSYSAAHPDWYQTDFIHLMPSRRRRDRELDPPGDRRHTEPAAAAPARCRAGRRRPPNDPRTRRRPPRPSPRRIRRDGAAALAHEGRRAAQSSSPSPRERRAEGNAGARGQVRPADRRD